MLILRILGIFFVVALIWWTLANRHYLLAVRLPPTVLGTGSQLNDQLTIPPKVIDAEIQKCNTAIEAINSRGDWLDRISKWASWASFALTSLITIIAGFRGERPAAQSDEPGEGESADESVRRAARTSPKGSHSLVVVLGVLAATSSVCTGVSSKVLADAQDYYRRADELHNQVADARKDLFAEDTTDDQADQILDDLEIKRKRADPSDP